MTAHHESKKYSRLEPIIRPQLIMFGSFSPRKLNPASNKMAVPMTSVAETISGGSALGSMTRHMMCALAAPMARAAFTYSSCLMRMYSARTSRAVGGQLTTPMAAATVDSDGLNKETSTIANNSGGST